MSAKHTPGPWRFNNALGETWTICDSFGESLMGAETYYPWVPDAEADWRLIAAAPDLLEALQALIDMDVAYKRGNRVEDAVEKARAAILKATGEQQ